MSKINEEHSKLSKSRRDREMNDEGSKRIIIETFRHMEGKNCQVSSMRKTLAYYDIDLSEEMLLGLASGLGFMYWDSKQMPFPFVGGLNGKEYTIFENALNAIDGSILILKQTASRKTSYNLVLDALEKGNPVISFVDMAYLPYFFSENAPYPNENAGHFGGHTFVVYGIDEREDKVYVSDRFGKPNTMKIKHFMDAHSSTFAPFPAKNKKLIIKTPQHIEDLEDKIFLSIKKNSEIMLNPPITNFGLKGILKFGQMVKKTWMHFKPEKLLFTLFNSFIYNATGGSGGALFRNMYTDFLKESFDISGKNELDQASSLYREAAYKWNEIAEVLLPDELGSLKKMRELMIENNRIQEEAKENYQKILAGLDNQMTEALNEAKEEVKNYTPYFETLQQLIEEVYEFELKAWELLGNL